MKHTDDIEGETEHDRMFIRVSPLVEKMRAKYPPELNMDGLEPALTADIANIALTIRNQTIEEERARIRDGVSKLAYREKGTIVGGVVYRRTCAWPERRTS